MLAALPSGIGSIPFYGFSDPYRKLRKLAGFSVYAHVTFHRVVVRPILIPSYDISLAIRWKFDNSAGE